MQENYIEFQHSIFQHLLNSTVSIVIFIITISNDKLGLNSLTAIFYGTLVYIGIKNIIGIFKSILSIPILVLDEQFLYIKNVELVIPWEKVTGLKYFAGKNPGFEIQLTEPYTNLETIKDPILKFYYWINNIMKFKNITIHFSTIKGKDEIIFEEINQFYNYINTSK